MSLLNSGYDPETKIWFGPIMEEFSKPEATIGEVIRQSLQRHSGKIGQISANSGVTLTNEEILLRSLKIASYLTKKIELKNDDVVTVIARNTENLAPLIFGLFNCGVSVNTLDTSLDEDEILNLLEYIKPKAIFCDADKYPGKLNALRTVSNLPVPIYIVSENIETKMGVSVREMINEVSSKDANDFKPNDPKDPKTHSALIICSSGTTGPSKGVCIPHTYLLPHEKLRVLGAEIVLCLSSLYWMSSWHILLRGTMNGATRIISDEPFSPELMLRLIEKYQVELIASSPPQMALMVNWPDLERRDLTSLKVYICGGGVIYQHLCDDFLNRIRPAKPAIIIAYGCTEILGIANMLYDSTGKVGSVGKLNPNFKLKIIDEDGAQQGPNERGEICVKSPYQFLRYLDRPEDTAKTVDAEGWVHTGDLGFMDDDGYLYLVDRKKEIIKCKGYQVSPSELEGVLRELPGVIQACVFGVPDPAYIDLPVALIVRDSKQDLSEEGVHAFMKSRTSDYKQLRGGVYFVDSLPMTPSGKVCLPKAKEMYKRLKGN